MGRFYCYWKPWRRVLSQYSTPPPPLTPVEDAWLFVRDLTPLGGILQAYAMAGVSPSSSDMWFL